MAKKAKVTLKKKDSKTKRSAKVSRSLASPKRAKVGRSTKGPSLNTGAGSPGPSLNTGSQSSVPSPNTGASSPGQPLNTAASSPGPSLSTGRGAPLGEAIDAQDSARRNAPAGMTVYDPEIGYGVALPGESGVQAVERIKAERANMRRKAATK